VSWYDVRDGNPLKRLLVEGRPAVGVFVRMPSLEIVEMCGHAGCDFIIIDGEHAPLGWERIAALAMTAENAGITPLIRVSNGTRDLISRGLDSGAHGVMVPQIESAQAARDAVAAATYGPQGTRGTAGNARTGYGMVMGYDEYVGPANEARVVVIQIESAASVENIEEIAAVDGIDCLFVGLTDLSVNLGHPGEYSHPEVEEHFDRVLIAAANRGIPVGVPASDSEMASRYIDRGAALVGTSDTGLFGRSVRAFVEGVDRSNA
jgi:2-keto-3-deoxy-L-rhamnonate aldolase RhmA